MAATTATAPPYPGHPTMYATNTLKPMRKTPGFRVAFLSHLLYTLGAAVFIAASALFVASQSRFFLSSPVAPFPNTTSSKFTAACVLAIIGSAIWVIASLIHILAARSEMKATRLMMGDNMHHFSMLPRYISAWSFMMFIGSILILIGSAIFIGKSFNDVSAGSILWLIGFALWAFGTAYELSLSMMAQSMAPMMWDMSQRMRAWQGTFGSLIVLVSTIFFCLGSILWIGIRPPGAWFTASLLWLVASIVNFWGHVSLLNMRWHYHVPVLSMLAAEAYGAQMMRGGAMPMTAGQKMPAGAPVGGSVSAESMPATTAAGSAGSTVDPMHGNVVSGPAPVHVAV